MAGERRRSRARRFPELPAIGVAYWLKALQGETSGLAV
jgi:hypothetical protein